MVTRFGKFSHLVEPGLNWKPTFIDEVKPVNVEAVRELAASGVMLTSDENVVRVEMNVQYRVTNPEKYLYSVTSPDDEPASGYRQRPCVELSVNTPWTALSDGRSYRDS